MSTFPVAIREHLAASRTARRPFDDAWQIATAACPPPAAEVWDSGTIDFMRHHMRHAYEGRGGKIGTFRPEPPTPTAIALSVAHNASQTHAEPTRTCRSGDGCPRTATMGRFGPMWCAIHGTELERCRERESAWNSTPRSVRPKVEAA